MIRVVLAERISGWVSPHEEHQSTMLESFRIFILLQAATNTWVPMLKYHLVELSISLFTGIGLGILFIVSLKKSWARAATRPGRRRFP